MKKFKISCTFSGPFGPRQTSGTCESNPIIIEAEEMTLEMVHKIFKKECEGSLHQPIRGSEKLEEVKD